MSAGIALIGGRGYAGRELLGLIIHHAEFEVRAVASRSHAGRLVREQAPDFGDDQLCFCDYSPESVFATPADAYVLAMPNGQAASWVNKIRQRQPDAVIVDLSADYRTDGAWVYGLPEINRSAIRGARNIANPGCYATAAALALWPLRDYLSGTPRVFGVSGYSGAGSTPSPKNDPDHLRENLLPYQLTGHAHQQELGRVLQRDVMLMPHVANYFRGLSVTVTADIDAPATTDLNELYRRAYADEPLIKLLDDAAQPAPVAGTNLAAIGPLVLDGRNPQRVVITAALDNLRKGAATQALQNLNLAFGFSERMGMSGESQS